MLTYREDREYPYPKYTNGVTFSSWIRVPADVSEDTTLFAFTRTDDSKGVGSLRVNASGQVMFFQGTRTAEDSRNSYVFNYDMSETDILSRAGEWVYLTVTIENDYVGIYFDGVEAPGETDSNYRFGTTSSKFFNKGFSYRGAAEGLSDPEIFKNYRDLLTGFTPQERFENNFTDWSKYTFLNSSEDLLMDFVTDEQTKFYIGGDDGNSIWGFAKYTDVNEGVLVDDLSFFGSVLSAEEIAQLYNEAEKKSDDIIDPTDEPDSTEEPDSSVA
ncbi:MAG: LamG-like jellyroll fold domain-containing protein [Lachnospiraceae bacterium]